MFFLLPVFLIIGLINVSINNIDTVGNQQDVLIPTIIVFALLPICIAICTYGSHFLISRNPNKAESVLSTIALSPYLFFVLATIDVNNFTNASGNINILIKYCIGSQKNLQEILSYYLWFLSDNAFVFAILAKLALLIFYYVILGYYIKVFDYFNKKGQADYQSFSLPEFFELNKIIVIGFVFLILIELISVGSDWHDNFLNRLMLQQGSENVGIIYLVSFLQIIMPLFLPFILLIIVPLILPILAGWQPLPKGDALALLEKTAKQNNFRYRKIYLAPKPGLVTAGVIGVFPWATNLVFTRDILTLLNEDELEAVMLHEIGHVKHLHLVSYFALLSLFQLVLMVFALSFGPVGQSEMTVMVISIGLLLLGIRYIWGGLSRFCERQADLYAAEVQGHPQNLISSFLKISALGISLDKPSWHHGSLRTRINNLAESFNENGPIIRKEYHNKVRNLKLSVIGLFLCSIIFVPIFNANNFANNELVRLQFKYQTAFNFFFQKKYTESAKLWDEIAHVAANVDSNKSEKEKEVFRHFRLISLYNSACAYSLSNKPEEAVKNLMATLPLFIKSDMQNTIDEALNVKKINSDTDLDSLRNRDDFKEFVKALEAKEKELGVVAEK